jgi:hypothetical protein
MHAVFFGSQTSGDVRITVLLNPEIPAISWYVQQVLTHPHIKGQCHPSHPGVGFLSVTSHHHQSKSYIMLYLFLLK